MNLDSAKTNGMDFLKKLRKIGAFFERENDVINRFGCEAANWAESIEEERESADSLGRKGGYFSGSLDGEGEVGEWIGIK